MQKKEVQNSIIKSLFALVPFAGQPLNELFFDYRGRIKQERLNDFTLLLTDYFGSKTEAEFKNLNIIEFSDLFESVILRVAHTGSQQKHKRFRDILINYIEQPDRTIDHSETYLELVSTLNEQSIQILKFHEQFDQQFEDLDGKDNVLRHEMEQTEQKMREEKTIMERGHANNYSRFSIQATTLKMELQSVQKKIEEIGKYRTAEFYNLSDNNFLYLKQILLSRALLTDSGAGNMGYIAYKYMRITEFGKQFIGYLRED